jgi:hypothetical protein
MFANVPCLLARDHVGACLENINADTGLLVEDADLPRVLRSVHENGLATEPLRWARAHVSAAHSREALEAQLEERATRMGYRWTRPIFQKVNRPYMRYIDRSMERRMVPAYRNLALLLRSRRKDLGEEPATLFE